MRVLTCVCAIVLGLLTVGRAQSPRELPPVWAYAQPPLPPGVIPPQATAPPTPAITDPNAPPANGQPSVMRQAQGSKFQFTQTADQLQLRAGGLVPRGSSADARRRRAREAGRRARLRALPSAERPRPSGKRARAGPACRLHRPAASRFPAGSAPQRRAAQGEHARDGEHREDADRRRDQGSREILLVDQGAEVHPRRRNRDGAGDAHSGRDLLSRGGTATEPIGVRIIETPEDVAETQLRNPRSGFIAYAPVGSIKRGEVLATTGGNGKTTPCAVCHGPDLKGLATDAEPGRPVAELSRAADVRHQARHAEGTRCRR